MGPIIDWLTALDPFARRMLLAAAGLLLLVLVLRIMARRREAQAAARRRAELRHAFDSVRMLDEEINRLAEQIVATSSTARLAGFAIVRQVEAVFTDARPSSVAALELCKALAAQKGANAVINLQARQMPSGKWVASGDAVVVKTLDRRVQAGA